MDLPFNSMDVSPLVISLQTAFCATAITFFLGIYMAWKVAGMQRFQGMADAVITLPMVLPPTVVGFFLLLLFGKNSPVGQALMTLGYSFVFSWEATVVAAIVVSLPLMYRTTRGAFEQLDPNLIYAAQTLGISDWRIFWRIVLPNALHGIMAGTILSFTRALGEFGATIMVAGNIPGRTQTMSTAIYSAVQAGDDVTAFRWVILVAAFSFIIIILMNYWMRLQKGGRLTVGAGKRRQADGLVR